MLAGYVVPYTGGRESFLLEQEIVATGKRIPCAGARKII